MSSKKVNIEDEIKPVQAWGHLSQDGELSPNCYASQEYAETDAREGDVAVPVIVSISPRWRGSLPRKAVGRE